MTPTPDYNDELDALRARDPMLDLKGEPSDTAARIAEMTRSLDKALAEGPPSGPSAEASARLEDIHERTSHIRAGVDQGGDQ